MKAPGGPSHLGVVDWGIGGTDFLARFRRAEPRVPVTYFSDTGATPYGKLSRVDLAERLARVIAFLASRGITDLVVACNAASTVLDHPRVRSVSRERGLRAVSGVIGPALEATKATRARSIGVIGGRRTILSRIYARELSRAGFVVRQRIAQPLSALVERGELDGVDVERAIARVVRPLRDVDALVLACTHYTALAPLLRAYYTGPFVDPAEATLGHVRRTFDLGSSRGRLRADLQALTTGDPRAMARAARVAFGVELARIERVRIGRAPPR